ncbi:MAG TPA: hypothetical protein VEB59_08205 [Gemmatimonadales bacterium]|nr:hypothetical protein [Gemmatimonadales bacterium]
MRALARPAYLAGVVAVVIAVALALPSPLWALGLAVAQEVTDRTGVFGPVIDRFWPVIVTFLTSLVVKIAAVANEGFARTSEPVKWAALYFLAFGFNFIARWLGTGELDLAAPDFSLALVEGTAAALVYKFGQHRVPTIAT